MPAPRDANRIAALQLTSNDGNRSATDWWIDPVTHRALVNATGTVTATSEKSSSTTPTSISTSTTSTQVLAANSSRIEAIIVNDSAAILYLKYGTTASSSSYSVILQPYDTLIETHYTGRIDGILASGTGTARVTEI